MFADENFMVPESFVFPNKYEPTVLPCFGNGPSGETNTGLLYKETDCALRKFEDNTIFLQIDETIHQQMNQIPPELIMPFQIFIDGTLVAINLIQPISICPGIFNRSMRNLAISLFIMG